VELELKYYGTKTDQGPYLVVNDDAYEIDLVNQLYIVLDGGGLNTTSKRIIDIVKDDIKFLFTKISTKPDATQPFFFNPKFSLEGNALINAVTYAHNKLFKQNGLLPIGSRYLASVTAMTFSHDLLTIVSSGNISAYISRRGHFTKVIIEDDLNILSGEKSQVFRNSCPLGALGLFEDVYLQIRELKIQNGDVVSIFSDGGCNRIELKELKAIIEKTNQLPQKKIEEIFNLNNQRGNLDNQTGMILGF
jgi:serine/threonine protein phosphatase PrpC